jgi:hypothetical protein
LRREAAELQKQRITTPTGTNNILEIIRDYEIAAGIRQPDAPPEETPGAPPATPPPEPEPPPPATVVATEPVLTAPVPEAATPRSRKPIVSLGAVLLLAAIASVGAWRTRRRKAGR